MSLFDLLTEEQQAERYSCCIRKIRHPTEEDAKRSMGRIKARGEQKPLHIYYCPYCFHWHVGGIPETIEEENKIRVIDGFPFRKVSIQHSPEDAHSFKTRMQRKGYWVRIRRKSAKNRKNYLMYVYHPARDAVGSYCDGVTA